MIILNYLSFLHCFSNVPKSYSHDIKSKENICPLPSTEEVFTGHFRVGPLFICEIIASFSSIIETKASVIWQW